MLFFDGEGLGQVPLLAICQARNKCEVVLYFCEKGFNSIAVSVHDSVVSAKRKAARIYPGSSARWIEAHVSDEEVTRYLDDLYEDFRRSFCGKRGNQASQMFSASGSAENLCRWHRRIPRRPRQPSVPIRLEDFCSPSSTTYKLGQSAL